MYISQVCEILGYVCIEFFINRINRKPSSIALMVISSNFIFILFILRFIMYWVLFYKCSKRLLGLYWENININKFWFGKIFCFGNLCGYSNLLSRIIPWANKIRRKWLYNSCWTFSNFNYTNYFRFLSLNSF